MFEAFRRISIVLINAAILFMLARIILFDENSDALGAFGIASLIFLFVYNVYALILYNVFWENPRKLWYLEAAYVLLLLLPMIFLHHMFS
ncbi:hypothetical protein KK062_20120 [Fulvivirgaceae bacterium PWU5]|uniref:Uncharacterized protein n=1 Tax=Dawidia cretensis TaxID=2782350 RepID=A0AAP2GRA9_9BACT|nr:hypothetical protein [Dawidia cretensis]MBT1710561.1 hypothetical protein [Dawidia cretensis]